MNLSKKILSILLSLLFVVPLPLLTSEKAYAQAPRVYLEPTPLQLNAVGATGTIGVKLENVTELSGFQLELSFDKAIIKVDSVSLLTPPAGVTFIPLSDIRNDVGKVTLAGISTYNNSSGKFDNVLSGSPVVLAALTVSAVGEGATALEFIPSSSKFYRTEVDASGSALELDVSFTNGQVKVGETPPEEGPTINLSSGGNRIIWPGGLADFTSLSALESIKTDCGSVGAISRKKNGWWESAVHGYGGTNFSLSVGSSYFVEVTSSCSWTP